MQKSEPSDAAGEGQCCSHFGKLFFKMLNKTQKHYVTPQPTPSTYPRELKTHIDTESFTGMFTAAVFIKAKKRKQPKCPSADAQVDSGGRCTRRHVSQQQTKEWSDTHYNMDENRLRERSQTQRRHVVWFRYVKCSEEANSESRPVASWAGMQGWEAGKGADC